MDATSTANLTGDRGTYTVTGGNEVEVTITEVYETEWQSDRQTTYTRSFSISGDTITFDDGSQLTRFPLP